MLYKNDSNKTLIVVFHGTNIPINRLEPGENITLDGDFDVYEKTDVRLTEVEKVTSKKNWERLGYANPSI